MPINNIPGVGPTNADIATAVAAPSAATIAAAVAAPSSATIASAVAAAVPTNASITSIVQANSGGTSDNWTLISSVTPTAGSTSVSITGLSGYKKLMHKVLDPGMSGNGTIYVTINSDSGNNYAWAAMGTTTSAITIPLSQYDGSFYRLQSTTSSGSLRQILTINNTNTTGVKSIQGFAQSSNPGGTIYYPSISGQYFASAVVSSIQLTVVGITFSGSGTVQVYGVAA